MWKKKAKKRFYLKFALPTLYVSRTFQRFYRELSKLSKVLIVQNSLIQHLNLIYRLKLSTNQSLTKFQLD
jgi:hypothetical protein